MLKFCQWKALWWAEQAPCCSGLHAPLAEGLQAYAAEQANMEHRICLAWTTKWTIAHKLTKPIIQAALGEEPAAPAGGNGFNGHYTITS